MTRSTLAELNYDTIPLRDFNKNTLTDLGIGWPMDNTITTPQPYCPSKLFESSDINQDLWEFNDEIYVRDYYLEKQSDIIKIIEKDIFKQFYKTFAEEGYKFKTGDDFYIEKPNVREYKIRIKISKVEKAVPRIFADDFS